MFGKLLLVILVMGCVACLLLVNRQQRIETAHECARIYRVLVDQRQTMWALREEIAERCRPDQVRLAAAALADEWAPLPADPATRMRPLPLPQPYELAVGR